LELTADILAVIASLAIQYYIRFETSLFGAIKPNIINDWEIIIYPLVALLIYWIGLFALNGMYRNWYEKSPIDEIFTMLKLVGFGCLMLAIVVISYISTSPRMLILIYFFVLSVNVIVFRTISRRIQLSLRRRKIINLRTIFIGKQAKASKLARKMQLSPSWGYRPIGIISTSDSGQETEETKVTPILGNLANFKNILEQYKPDAVVIGSKTSKNSNIFNIVNYCKDMNISVKIEPDLYHIFTGQSKASNLYGIPLIDISLNLLKPWQKFAKRLFDILFSIFVLVVGLPVWLLISLIIVLESRGGVFYSQPRIGRHGKEFQIYKFRSMVASKPGAEQRWTTVGDKRVTKFGHFIRKTHLDEVPQFWNCLKGDMSIVGPRPEQPNFVKSFSEQLDYYNRRHKVRPGITGWWQIKYTPFELSLEEIESRTKDDFHYIENMSLKLDFEIILRTIWVVLKGHGQT
jgi:exopolysaccharide biosynthesis polyprenyl glycosylphosphotransferase